MNILFLYNATQTYTNTVFEHLQAFAKYSEYHFFFAHHDQYQSFNIALEPFDAVIVHYSVRLPFDQVSLSAAAALSRYSGMKMLFIQDEYSHTRRAWHWMKKIGFHLVFTVVPEKNIEKIYPAAQFPGMRFVNNLTGYVPECLNHDDVIAPSQRKLIVGYRGRPLPVQYGKLGFEKVGIGQLVKEYCDAKGIQNDIAWVEEARIYGPRWYEFMASCRAMLGSESGSNVFDWDGSLEARIQQLRAAKPQATDMEVYNAIIKPLEVDGLMNQVSPRVFEAIAAKTVLVLFEGEYSGVVKPGEHFIPLRKDGANLGEVFTLLSDADYVDAMAERAYQDVIASGKYSYRTFVAWVDQQIKQSVENMLSSTAAARGAVGQITMSQEMPTLITTLPIRATISRGGLVGKTSLLWRLAGHCWHRLPEAVRNHLRPGLKQLFGRG